MKASDFTCSFCHQKPAEDFIVVGAWPDRGQIPTCTECFHAKFHINASIKDIGITRREGKTRLLEDVEE